MRALEWMAVQGWEGRLEFESGEVGSRLVAEKAGQSQVDQYDYTPTEAILRAALAVAGERAS